MNINHFRLIRLNLKRRIHKSTKTICLHDNFVTTRGQRDFKLALVIRSQAAFYFATVNSHNCVGDSRIVNVKDCSLDFSIAAFRRSLDTQNANARETTNASKASSGLHTLFLTPTTKLILRANKPYKN